MSTQVQKKGRKGLFCYEQSGSPKGGHCDKMVMDALVPLKDVRGSGYVVQQFVSRPQPLAFLTSVPVVSLGAQASGLLGPLPLLPSFSLQAAHLLLSSLGSHDVEVSKKMVLRPRA